MIDRARVSCSGLCLIQNEEGQYLLGFNRNSLPAKVLTPLGGALRFHNEALLNTFDARVEHDYVDPPKDGAPNHDLRLSLPAPKLEEFKTWFMERKDREISPFRELQEELTKESLLQTTPLLSRLEEGDVHIQFLFITPDQRSTDRRGYEGTWTHIFAEIYRVEFLVPEHVHTMATVGAAHTLRWVTQDEIVEGKTKSEQLPVSARILFGKPISDGSA